MKIKDYKCKCGCDDFFFADKGFHTGIYCSYCGKWFKWADREEQHLKFCNEQNLRRKQVSMLDKIKEEIKDNTYYINETTKKEVIDFETVEKIIDKYKIESEE